MIADSHRGRATAIDVPVLLARPRVLVLSAVSSTCTSCPCPSQVSLTLAARRNRRRSRIRRVRARSSPRARCCTCPDRRHRAATSRSTRFARPPARGFRARRSRSHAGALTCSPLRLEGCRTRGRLSGAVTCIVDHAQLSYILLGPHARPPVQRLIAQSRDKARSGSPSGSCCCRRRRRPRSSRLVARSPSSFSRVQDVTQLVLARRTRMCNGALHHAATEAELAQSLSTRIPRSSTAATPRCSSSPASARPTTSSSRSRSSIATSRCVAPRGRCAHPCRSSTGQSQLLNEF